MNLTRRPRQLIGVPLAAGALLLSAIAVPQTAQAAKDPNKVAKILAKEVSASKANRHLRALQRIADNNKGIRAAGTPGHEASAKYVSDRLTAAGYQVKTQEFTFTDFDFLAQTLKSTAPVQRNYKPFIARFSPSTPEGGLSAQLAVVPYSNDATPGCEASDYAGTDYKGKIALIWGGGCTNTIKQKTASEAGAAVALINTTMPAKQMNLRTRLVAADAKIPTATLTAAESEQLESDAAKGTVSLTVELRSKAKEVKTYNVLADTPTGRSDNTVIVGGHLDGVTEGPGINDNGSSTAMLLETAVKLAPHWNKVKNKVRFAWWSAEEHGLLGSAHYVSKLSEEERLDVALYLNFDMIGSPNFARMVYDGDDSDQTGSGPGPYGSAQIEKVFTDFFKGRNQPTVGRDFDGRSDYGSFIAVGIPSGGATSGSNLIKTPEWQKMFGGVTGQPTDWCYHQACDNLGNVNKTIFDQIGDSIAWATGRFAVTTEDVNGEESARARALRAKLAKKQIRVAPAEDC